MMSITGQPPRLEREEQINCVQCWFRLREIEQRGARLATVYEKGARRKSPKSKKVLQLYDTGCQTVDMATCMQNAKKVSTIKIRIQLLVSSSS